MPCMAAASWWARMRACMPACRCTNEYRHSGIRDDGTRIFDRLLGMVRETVLD